MMNQEDLAKAQNKQAQRRTLYKEMLAVNRGMDDDALVEMLRGAEFDDVAAVIEGLDPDTLATVTISLARSHIYLAHGGGVGTMYVDEQGNRVPDPVEAS